MFVLCYITLVVVLVTPLLLRYNIITIPHYV